MLNLVSTSDLISIITGSAVSTIYVHADFADYTGSTVTPANQNASITGAATTTVVAAPATAVQRAVKSLVIFNSHASSSNKITIQLVNASSTVQLFVYTLNAGETIMYGEDGKFYVIDATGQIKTAPGNVLTSPVINGTPTGTGIPTLTLKKGSGSGNYTTTATSYGDVDGTNLAYTVTIPTGWKLAIWAGGTAFQQTSVVGGTISLLDGSTILEQPIFADAINTQGSAPFALHWSITGDGASHTVKLQYKTGNASDTLGISNSSATIVPVMLFLLTPSN